MVLVIEYYSGEQKLCAVPVPSISLPDAVAAAREGLTRHNARYARVVDLGRQNKLVGLVHRDVRP